MNLLLQIKMNRISLILLMRDFISLFIGKPTVAKLINQIALKKHKSVAEKKI
jgi:hypothetical protein